MGSFDSTHNSILLESLHNDGILSQNPIVICQGPYIRRLISCSPTSRGRMFNPTLLAQGPSWARKDKRFLPGTGSRRDSAKMLSVWDVSEQDLVSAAKEGRVSEVEKILRRPQSPNVTDEYGETPLGHAVCAGHLEVVRVLLKARAHTDRPGRMSPCLHAASELGHLDIVRLLLEKKSDKNAQDRVGSTALTRAATAGQLEIVRLLVSARADIDKFDRLNGTALKYAASKGHAQIVRFLLSKKADISTAGLAGDDCCAMGIVSWSYRSSATAGGRGRR